MDSYKKFFLITVFPICLYFCIAGCSRNDQIKIHKSDTELSRTLEDIEKENYVKITKIFSVVTVTELKKGIPSNIEEETYIYVGRSTCPDCRNFILKLNNNIPSNYKIYYIDTDRCSKSEINYLSEIKVSEVPSMIHLNQSGEIKLIKISNFEREIMK